MTSQLWEFDGVEIARLVREKHVSATEVAEAHIARIDQVNNKLNAIVRRTDDDAREAATSVDNGSASGTLAGVAITTKINTDHVPYPMDNGIAALKDNMSPSTHSVIQGLVDAGGVMVGRTNSPSFAMRLHTGNDLHGQTLNPHGQHLTPGGSSGGAGVAVATGMCAIAQGNDVAGSVRWPAFCNGVYGLRPTIGRMPTGGTNPTPRGFTAMSMSTQGPLARTMADLRAAYSAMLRPNWADPFWIPAPHRFEEPTGRIKVALVVEDGRPMSDATKNAMSTAGRHLADAGYDVEEVSPPGLDTLFSMWVNLAAIDMKKGLQTMLPTINDSGLTRAFECMDPLFPAPTPEVLMRAVGERDLLLRLWNKFLAEYPIIVMPVLTEPFLTVDADTQSTDSMREAIDALRYTFNLPALGIPSLAVPIGHHNGAPQGVQLAAHTWREDLLLDAGDALELRLGKVKVVDPTW